MKIFCLQLTSILIGIGAGAKGKYCFKRFVDEEWEWHGDCENLDVLNNVVQDIARQAMKEAIIMPPSCDNIDPGNAKSRNQTGGVFDISITDIGVTEVYCDTETDDGQWIVFQRRMDGSENFDRSWDDYVHGFGTSNSEFWLGLEKIHQLTKYGYQELRIDMIGRYSKKNYYAKYRSFVVGPASENYKLNVSGYNGNASDAMTQHDECVFSTSGNDDSNNAIQTCGGITLKGGWWCHKCTKSNLNGVFNGIGIRWIAGLHVIPGFVEMKLRKQH